MNETEKSAISVDEFYDGEIFCFTEVLNGENQCEMWFDRKCAYEILTILSQMLGVEECPE